MAKLSKEWDLFYSWHSTPPDQSLLGTPVHLDLCNKRDVHKTLTYFKPDVVIHTACSNRSENSIVPAIENIVSTVANSTTRLVHVSTDMVLDATTLLIQTMQRQIQFIRMAKLKPLPNKLYWPTVLQL